MLSGIVTYGLGESSYEILEDVSAVNCADLVRTEVALRGVELLDDKIEGIGLHELLESRLEVELGEYVLHVA